MRGRIIGRSVSAHPSAIGSVPFQNLISSSSAAAFSTSSSGWGGRGRGRGGGSIGGFTPGSSAVKPDSNGLKPESNESPFPSGLGHGQGNPIPTQPTPPILPSFPSWTASVTPPPSSDAGRGRGRGASRSPESADSRLQSTRPLGPGKPIPSFKDEGSEMAKQTRPRVWGRDTDESVGKHHIGNLQANDVLPPPIGSEIVHQTRPRVWDSGRGAGDGVRKPVNNLQANGVVPELPSVDGGAGRGKPVQPLRGQIKKIEEENRHLRGRGGGGGGGSGGHTEAAREERPRPASPKLSRPEAVKTAIGILSRGEAPVRGRGPEIRWGGRGGRGRGRGRRGQQEDGEDNDALDLGNDADGEKLAEALGVEKMNTLHGELEEAFSSVLPSPLDEAYKEALHINYSIELEPEFMMEEHGRNPDIDEKPPISLRNFLEMVKPFMVAYENIGSQEEWEEVVEETMKIVPDMKRLVEYYSGPELITAKTQQEELGKVAKKISESAPDSVKHFANHAVHCLQSNPGWKYHQKCQFMDMLSRHVSKHYKQAPILQQHSK